MHCKHRDTEFGGSSGSAGYLIWNVVKLEVQKHASAGANDFFYYFGTGSCKELGTDLEHSNHIAQRCD